MSCLQKQLLFLFLYITTFQNAILSLQLKISSDEIWKELNFLDAQTAFTAGSLLEQYKDVLLNLFTTNRPVLSYLFVLFSNISSFLFENTWIILKYKYTCKRIDHFWNWSLQNLGNLPLTDCSIHGEEPVQLVIELKIFNIWKYKWV